MNLEIIHFDSLLEQLDNGIFFEVIGKNLEVSEATLDEEFIFGCADADCVNWSYQFHENADGVSCLKYVIEQLTPVWICEKELCDYAEGLNYFDWETGISTGDMIHILEQYDLAPEYYEHSSLQDLMEMLEEGKAICIVNRTLLESEALLPYKGSCADAYVQVIEIDIRDPLHQSVRLNVPFDPKGAGKVYDLSAFINSWRTGNQAVIFVNRRT